MYSEDFYNFIQDHESDNPDFLRLKFASKKDGFDFPVDLAIVQIEARRKCRKKIPGFLTRREFLFPSIIAAEQASNEAVARYHASLISDGCDLLDMTAGLGIDDMTFALNGIDVTACEIEQLKCKTLQHNVNLLGISHNIDVKCVDSIEFLKVTDQSFDVIFIDPARRGESGKRLHALSDCFPDIVGNLSLIMAHTDRLLVKSSPLLDLSLIRQTVQNLCHIHVVCFRGEVKEVLIEINIHGDFSGITVMDLDWDKVISTFAVSPQDSMSHHELRYAEKDSPSTYQYLYEPNAGVMKTGAWSALEALFPDIVKADQSTHLFLSDTLYPDFPGRILKIGDIADKKILKSLKGEKFNVVARNYPLSPQQIGKKYSLLSGADRFLYAFRYRGVPVMMTARVLIDVKSVCNS